MQITVSNQLEDYNELLLNKGTRLERYLLKYKLQLQPTVITTIIKKLRI